MRMEDRLQFAVTVPQGLCRAQFPPMMLQSLVENSIKHGLEPKPRRRRDDDLAPTSSTGDLRVTVADTGLGFAAATRPAPASAWPTCASAWRRCTAARRDSSIEANAPSGTIATIEVPYQAVRERRCADAVTRGVPRIGAPDADNAADR